MAGQSAYSGDAITGPEAELWTVSRPLPSLSLARNHELSAARPTTGSVERQLPPSESACPSYLKCRLSSPSTYCTPRKITDPSTGGRFICSGATRKRKSRPHSYRSEISRSLYRWSFTFSFAAANSKSVQCPETMRQRQAQQ